MKKIIAVLMAAALLLPLCFVSVSAAETNVLYCSPEELAAAGVATVKDYHTSGLSRFSYKTYNGWGRAGFSGINGMAAVCDGVKEMPQITPETKDSYIKDATLLYWKMKNTATRHTADGVEDENGKYICLIGYEFFNDWYVNVDSFTLYLDGNECTKNINGFDILVGSYTGNGFDVDWNVVWSGENLITENKYLTYDDNTAYIDGIFDKSYEGQCIEIGITSLADDSQNFFYMTEFELYGEVYEKAPATTAAPETTAAPATSEEPAATSADPAATSADPAATSAEPAATSEEPAVTTAAPAATTAAPAETTAAAKGGCGSAVSGVIAVIAVIGMGITAVRKKH